MKSFVAESGVEEACLDYFLELGWEVAYGPEIAPGEVRAERASFRGAKYNDKHNIGTAFWSDTGWRGLRWP